MIDTLALLPLDKIAMAIKEVDNGPDIHDPDYYHGIATVTYIIADQLEPTKRTAFLKACDIVDYCDYNDQ